MSTDPKKPAPARTAGPQTLLMIGVIIVLGALGFLIGMVVSGWGISSGAPANNSAEAAAPTAPTPGGGQLLPSGLRIQMVREGSGPAITRTDRVYFRYELRRYGGPVIESNMNAPQAAVMPVSGLIPGFAEGLTHMRAGGEARLWVPPQLGYGADIPPGSPFGPADTLEFLVRVERIAPPAPATPDNESAAAPVNASEAQQNAQ